MAFHNMGSRQTGPNKKHVTFVNNQYNSPMDLYSPEEVVEAMEKHRRLLANGAVGVDFNLLSAAHLNKSEVYKMLTEEESQTHHDFHQQSYIVTAETKRVAWPPIPERHVTINTNEMIETHALRTNNERPSLVQLPSEVLLHQPQQQPYIIPIQQEQEQQHKLPQQPPSLIQPQAEVPLHHQQQQPYIIPIQQEQHQQHKLPQQPSSLMQPQAEVPLQQQQQQPYIIPIQHEQQHKLPQEQPFQPANIPMDLVESEKQQQQQHQQEQAAPSSPKTAPKVHPKPILRTSSIDAQQVQNPVPTSNGKDPEQQSDPTLPSSVTPQTPEQKRRERFYRMTSRGMPEPFSSNELVGDRQIVAKPAPPPGLILNRAHKKQAPFLKESPVVVRSEPFFKRATPVRMLGDMVWPPKNAATSAPEKQQSLPPQSPGTVRRQNKNYREFFSQNQLPPNFPTYRAPPGTQHFGLEEGENATAM